MVRYTLLLVFGLSLFGCEAETDGLEECSEAPEPSCSKMVSCCDLVFAEDPSASSLAGESCLIDQSIALDLYDNGKPNDATCDAMLLKDEYQELCFSCAAGETGSENGSGDAAISSEE